MTQQTLTEQDYRNLKTGLAHIQSTLEMLVMASKAGLEVDNEIANMEATRFKFESILKEFFPHRP